MEDFRVERVNNDYKYSVGNCGSEVDGTVQVDI